MIIFVLLETMVHGDISIEEQEKAGKLCTANAVDCITFVFFLLKNELFYLANVTEKGNCKEELPKKPVNRLSAVVS